MRKHFKHESFWVRFVSFFLLHLFAYAGFFAFEWLAKQPVQRQNRILKRVAFTAVKRGRYALAVRCGVWKARTWASS